MFTLIVLIDLFTFTSIQIEDGEEWNDFEDEREKDYRGLKIQHLNIR